MTKIIPATIDQLSALGTRFRQVHPAEAHRWAEVIHLEDGLHVPDDLEPVLRALMPDQADAVRDQRGQAAKAECRRRILAVASETAQMNMAASAAAGLMSDDDVEAFRDWCTWRSAMINRARSLAGGDAPIEDDGTWPVIPKNAAALAAYF